MGRKKIPLSFIEDLLSRVDIVDVISQYLTLKQVGRNYSALCPFHPEKTPSFVVSPEKQIFKCFGCGVGGTAITFIEKYENLSFYEAVKRLCEITGIEFPSEFSEIDEETDILYETAYEVAKYFHSKVEKIKDYLLNRNLENTTIKRFLLGYAPETYLKDLKKDREILKKLNLVTEKGKPFFANRLIIPIFNHTGKIVAFGARALRKNQTPKYINSPENDIFHKGNILYGFYQAKENILKDKEVIVVEGYFDVISLFQAGIEKAVAPMGTSLTENHAKTLKRYAKKIVLFFDGDSAGERATLRAAEIFAKLGVEPFIARPPEGEDPDSLSRNKKLLDEIISQALPLSKYLIKLAKTSSLEEKTDTIKQVVSIFSYFDTVDPFKLRRFLSELSVETDSDIKWLKSLIKTANRSFTKETTSSKLPTPEYEKAFIKGLLERKIPSKVEISPNLFISDECRKLYILLKHSEKPPNPIELEKEYPELGGILAELSLTEFTEDEIKAALCRVLKKEIERKLRNVKEFNIKKKLKLMSINLSNKEVGGIEDILSCIN
ncbi:DNA primase [Desulfurobacterium atlanticum]|uniref:DNA primase n=1 Tax=Desulfurobacterium atlanticum TaxID=240169 RepID=A0A238Z3F6_9BACT|nr:DNA primase [Desulfurobacterium atlanticum]SNR77762.1 DNA primase [Desulfurobacterium atlanticum]